MFYRWDVDRLLAAQIGDGVPLTPPKTDKPEPCMWRELDELAGPRFHAINREKKPMASSPKTPKNRKKHQACDGSWWALKYVLTFKHCKLNVWFLIYHCKAFTVYDTVL